MHGTRRSRQVGRQSIGTEHRATSAAIDTPKEGVPLFTDGRTRPGESARETFVAIHVPFVNQRGFKVHLFHAPIMGCSWDDVKHPQTQRNAAWVPDPSGVMVSNGADDGIRTRDPHLGKVKRLVTTCVRWCLYATKSGQKLLAYTPWYASTWVESWVGLCGAGRLRRVHVPRYPAIPVRAAYSASHGTPYRGVPAVLRTGARLSSLPPCGSSGLRCSRHGRVVVRLSARWWDARFG
jgi:hypothetical protein